MQGMPNPIRLRRAAGRAAEGSCCSGRIHRVPQGNIGSVVTLVVQAGGEEGGREPPPPGLLLLLARVCAFMEGTAVVHVMETLAAAFPGRGGGSGGDEPPAFVAGEIARCAH